MAHEPSPTTQAGREGLIDQGHSPAPPQQARLNRLALVSLALGLAGWTVLPVLGAVAAVITGHLSRIQIAASAGRMQGGRLALAGLLLGWLEIVLIFGVMLAVVIIGLRIRPGLIRLLP